MRPCAWLRFHACGPAALVQARRKAAASPNARTGPASRSVLKSVCSLLSPAGPSAVQSSFTMLMGVDGMNNGINYDPMNPMGTHDWSKDRKAANRIAGLVTK